MPSVVSVRRSHCDMPSVRSASARDATRTVRPVWALSTLARSTPRRRARRLLAAPSSATTPSPRMLPPYACRSTSSRRSTSPSRCAAMRPSQGPTPATRTALASATSVARRPDRSASKIDARGNLALEPAKQSVGHERAQEAHGSRHRHVRVTDQWIDLLQLTGHVDDALAHNDPRRADVHGMGRVRHARSRCAHPSPPATRSRAG